MKLFIPKSTDKFVFTEECKNGYRYSFTKGMKFVIKKIRHDYVEIKIISSMDECREAMDKFRKSIIRDHKKTIRELQFCVDLWNKDPKKFVIDRVNGLDKGKPHCINTGYHKIPQTHPDVFGMAKHSDKDYYDAIMTRDYKHKDGILNKYSYQKGYNEYYSKACYEYMILGDIEGYLGLNFFEKDSKELDKWLYKAIIEKHELTRKQFDKVSFEKV